LAAEDAKEHKVKKKVKKQNRADRSAKASAADAVSSLVEDLDGAVRKPMPAAIHPMLATPVEKPFDDPEWLFEIKWDGYRAVSFLQDGKVRLVSRNQNDLTAEFPELHELSKLIKAKTVVLDGEVVALDERGRASFSLMQQRTGIRKGGRRTGARRELQIVYYIFDLLYMDGYDLRRVALEQRKQVLSQIIEASDLVRYSDHFPQGLTLFEAAKKQGLEGILAKKRLSFYEERRSREWLKIKVTQTVDCVVGGYTDPEGSRQYFGAIVLGLYDKQGRLIHVGQAGTGFNQAMLKEIWQLLKSLETNRNPFHGDVDAAHVHWVKPERVAEIKFTEWTHETVEGGMKLRAPVFLGLREDKEPKECTFAEQT
jgi:bifunctional non-homologous end joining protein LigD